MEMSRDIGIAIKFINTLQGYDANLDSMYRRTYI